MTATVTNLRHWTGRTVRAWPSRTSGVLYVEDVRDNLVFGQIGSEPLPEAVARKRSDTAQAAWFDATASAALAARDGSISRLQSVRSEDAVTWSLFGPLLAEPAGTRAAFLDALLGLAGIAVEASKVCEIELWKRQPHPDTGNTAHGPEADVILRSDRAVVCVEAKWGAKEGDGQGSARNMTQRDMRVHTAKTLLTASDTDADVTVAAVIAIAPTKHPMLDPGSLWAGAVDRVEIRALSWEDAAKIPHPSGTEFADQLEWRTKLL